MKLFHLIITTLIFSVCANAQNYEAPTDFIVIKPLSSKLISQNEELNLNKTMLRVATKQTEYQLAFSQNVDLDKSKIKIVTMSLEIKNIGKLYNIEASLIDLKKDKTLNNIKKLRVSRQFVQREAQIALELLFFNETLSMEKKQLLKKKNEIKMAEEKEANDSGAIDFKKRILGLKKTLINTFNKLKKQIMEDKKKEELESQEDKDSLKKKTDAKKESVTTRRNQEDDNPNKEKGIKRVEEYSYIGLGYKSHDIRSIYYIDTNTFVTFLNFSYLGGTFWDFNSRYYSQYRFSYGKLISQIEQEISPAIELSYSGGRRFDFLNLSLEARLESSNTNFVNINEIGGGLIGSEISAIWLDLMFGKTFNIKNRDFKINSYFGSLISGNNNFDNVKKNSLTGVRYGFEVIGVNLYSNFSLLFGLYTLDLLGELIKEKQISATEIADKIKISGQSYNIGIRYTF